jgi:hypothetical protein
VNVARVFAILCRGIAFFNITSETKVGTLVTLHASLCLKDTLEVGSVIAFVMALVVLSSREARRMRTFVKNLFLLIVSSLSFLLTAR